MIFRRLSARTFPGRVYVTHKSYLAAVCFLLVAREASGTEAMQHPGSLRATSGSLPGPGPLPPDPALAALAGTSPGSGHKLPSEKAVRTLEPIKKT